MLDAACHIIEMAVVDVYEISSNRVTCSFSSLSKRAINNGIAQVSVVDAGMTASASSGGMRMYLPFSLKGAFLSGSSLWPLWAACSCCWPLFLSCSS